MEAARMTSAIVVLMALIGFWLWLYFAALLWDGLGGRWAQKSRRGFAWLETLDAQPPSLSKALKYVAGLPYHAIWMRPGWSFAVSLLVLALLAWQLV
jgi:hypothetical protein